MLDAHKVNKIFLRSTVYMLIYTTVTKALRCSLDPVPGGQDRVVVRHQPGPKPDLGGKGGPTIYQMNARTCSLASRGLFSIPIKGDHDALWRTAQLCSVSSRPGETGPTLRQDCGFCLLTYGVKVS